MSCNWWMETGFFMTKNFDCGLFEAMLLLAKIAFCLYCDKTWDILFLIFVFLVCSSHLVQQRAACFHCHVCCSRSKRQLGAFHLFTSVIFSLKSHLSFSVWPCGWSVLLILTTNQMLNLRSPFTTALPPLDLHSWHHDSSPVSLIHRPVSFHP